MRVLYMMMVVLLLGVPTLAETLNTTKKTPSLAKTSFAGKVQSVNPQTNLLKVADDAGHILQMTATPSTEVLKDQKPVTLSQLRPNDQVVVRYWVDTSNNP